MQVQHDILLEESQENCRFDSIQGTKVGEIGRIDWFKTGNILDLQETYFTGLTIKLQLKLQSYLIKLRDSLELNRQFKKIKTLINFFFLLIFYLFIFSMVLIIPVIIQIGLSGLNFTSTFWYLVGIVFIFYLGASVYLIVVFKISINKVKPGIENLNLKLKQEGVHIQLRLKNEPWKFKLENLWNIMNFVEVFKYEDQLTFEEDHSPITY